MKITTTLTHQHTLVLTSDEPDGSFTTSDLAELVREIERLGLRSARVIVGVGRVTCVGERDATCLTALPAPRIGVLPV